MDTKNITDYLDKVGTPAVQETIAQYTHWHFVNALVYGSVGLIMLVVSTILIKFVWKTRKEHDDEISMWIFVFLVIIGVVGMLIIADNIVNIAYPRAYAIHQLIFDIRN